MHPPDMTSPKRYPRERFSRSLASLCRHLDSQHRKVVDYVAPLTDHVQLRGRLLVDARALWVFGSWAQGAAECGGLDIALDLRIEWADGHGWMREDTPTRRRPDFCEARKALVTAPPLVHFLDAAIVRAYGPSGEFAVHPSTLVPIWLAPDLNDLERAELGIPPAPARHWGDQIASIKADPAYKRAPRLCDALPLRPAQIGMYLGEAEAIVRAHERGIISWEFLPHGSHATDMPTLRDSERVLVAEHDCRDKALVSRAILATRALRQAHKRVLFLYGHRARISPRMFESRDAQCIVATPRWSSQGPNGSLVLTPGKNYSPASLQAFQLAESHRRTADL